MENQPDKNKESQFETEAEMDIQHQITESYQSGVVGQAGPTHIENPHQKEQGNHQLR